MPLPFGHVPWPSPDGLPMGLRGGAEKCSNFAVSRRAFCSLSPPEARFRQNVWETGTRIRVPKYGCLSGSSQGSTYRSFNGVPGKRLSLREIGET
jgi:hypothetical protein